MRLLHTSSGTALGAVQQGGPAHAATELLPWRWQQVQLSPAVRWEQLSRALPYCCRSLPLRLWGQVG